MLDAAELCAQILDSTQFQHITYSPLLCLAECYGRLEEAVGYRRNTRLPNTVLQPAGGVFYNGDDPVLLVHCVDLEAEQAVTEGAEDRPDEEGTYFAEIALFHRAAEMLFAAHDYYSVLFVVRGGTPAFWKYLEVLQFGRVQNRNICKVYSHGIPVILREEEQEQGEVVRMGRDMLAAAQDFLRIPTAER